MKSKFTIAISYPPLDSTKGSPFLSQNRQFQWTNTHNVIYPVVPAYGASLLQREGYQVIWDDAIAQGLTYDQWFERILAHKPDLVFIETKTPVIKKHWQIIKDLKQASLKTEDWRLKIVLMGDHVTALPQESLLNSPVDYILTGGDYDFMMLNLANHLTKNEKLEPGFWYCQSDSSDKSMRVELFNEKKLSQTANHTIRQNIFPKAVENAGSGNKIADITNNQPTTGSFHKQLNGSDKTDIINSGPFALKHHNLDNLPIIDRDLTQWQLYSVKNTNYKYTPGAYIMSARDCWWGKCTFCSWTTLYPGRSFRSHSVGFTIKEIENLVNNYGVKEIFDDAGTMPVGPWLKDLCQEIIKRGLHQKVVFGCNMRFGALNQEQYNLLKRANFRFILYGLESSNADTLQKINKMTKPEDAKTSLNMAKKAGLEPHLTIMIGYPWETYRQAKNTLNQARQFFREGLADSMQATRIIPYPGTPLFDQCQKEGLLLTQDWDDYDMRQPIIKSPITPQEQHQLIQDLFKGILTPKFLVSRILSIRSMADFKHYAVYAVKYIQKLQDFSDNS